MAFLLLLITISLSFSFQAMGQMAEPPLATAKGIQITASKLPPEARKKYENLAAELENTREHIFSTYLAELLLETEATERKISIEALQEEALRSVADPTTEAIKAVYDANRSTLGDTPLAEVRDEIVTLLRRAPEQNALQKQIEDLQKKYKLTLYKNINAPGLKQTDTIAAFGSKEIKLQEFERDNRIALSDQVAFIYDNIRYEIESALFSELILAEAKERQTEASSLLAREITDRLRDFTDEERADLLDQFKRRLFAKYGARILFKMPEPLVIPVSVDDDPAVGPANAPVTVVMFSDFQCPACSVTHPALKKVISEFAGKVRLVVRDYPLEKTHKNAFQAALAANAAKNQGKFFEFIEILYRNQEELDAASLRRFADEIGLDRARFEADISSASNADEVRKDISDGRSYGVSGTPTIFVNGIKVLHLSTAAFRDAIEHALSDQK